MLTQDQGAANRFLEINDSNRTVKFRLALNCNYEWMDVEILFDHER